MRRLASTALALLFIAWLEFQFFPGHSYLAGASQLYVPMLEHLQYPSYLTRDLVATHPHLAYTVYDELSFFFARMTRGGLQPALALQQLASRLALVTGLYLLARAAKMSRLPALLMAALVAAGTFLPAVNVWTTDPEPTPRSLAFGFAVLAMGAFSRQMFLFSSLAGGVALLFDAAAAAPFWSMAACCALFDRNMRRPLRPVAPILLIFVLLLANLSQLQTGTPDSQSALHRIPQSAALIQQFRSPALWVSCWHYGYVYLYLALGIVSIWAVTRISQGLSRAALWTFGLVPCLGVLTLAFSFAFLDKLRWASLLRWRPLELLAYTVIVGWILVTAAAQEAFARRKHAEAAAWTAISVLLLFGAFARLRPSNETPALDDLAAWAATGTWGSSMFAFPDAGRALYPGEFRARSLRAVWTDWESGRQINQTVALAPIWHQRWTQTMTGPQSGDHLQSLLNLPIDYFVFRAGHRVYTLLEGTVQPVKPVFANSDFRVYDASSLRLIPGRLLVR